ncbi:hypothetical protein LCGC14_1351270 [marine sediment metagenome]|uniref:Uncharacterized protein n=1 Tax=marine sediment metagenome TaxID=412755 RepID=A0A0F9KBL2_9ZZZZ
MTLSMTLTKINVRLDLKQLDHVGKKLGVDRSKTIRAALNCVENVLQNFFGGEVTDIFRRDPKNEKKALYKQR